MPRDEKQGIESVDAQVVFTGHAWHLIKDTFLFEGEHVTRDYIRHPGAVCIVAVQDDGEIIMVQQYRRAVDEQLWEIPAGYRDLTDESPLVSAQRELIEETGLVAEEWKPLVSFYTTPGVSSEMIHAFVATGLSDGKTEFIREHEEATMVHRSFPLQHLLDAIANGQIHNAHTVISLLAYARSIGE